MASMSTDTSHWLRYILFQYKWVPPNMCGIVMSVTSSAPDTNATTYVDMEAMVHLLLGLKLFLRPTRCCFYVIFVVVGFQRGQFWFSWRTHWVTPLNSQLAASSLLMSHFGITAQGKTAPCLLLWSAWQTDKEHRLKVETNKVTINDAWVSMGPL